MTVRDHVTLCRARPFSTRETTDLLQVLSTVVFPTQGRLCTIFVSHQIFRDRVTVSRCRALPIPTQASETRTLKREYWREIVPRLGARKGVNFSVTRVLINNP